AHQDRIFEVYLATVECAIDILNITVFECWNFFLPVIPSLAELPHEDQCAMMYSNLIVGLERKTVGRIDRSFSSELRCATYIYDWRMHTIVIRSIRVHIQDQMTKIVPSFLKADFCEHETHAFLALLLCDPGETTRVPLARLRFPSCKTLN
ncbi:hypothetical protein PENTCL1PPCAC_16431, partial [Pristionchus entomophagus]